MKAKSSIPKRAKNPPLRQLPDPLLIPQDIHDLPTITQAELLAYVSAERCYRVARADFEMKRAALTLKLLHDCEIESMTSNFDARLDKDGRVVFSDSSSSGPPEVTRS
ncbi:MAG: hypothetical protein ACREDR_18345 [Blastocatellia bacterium]